MILVAGFGMSAMAGNGTATCDWNNGSGYVTAEITSNLSQNTTHLIKVYSYGEKEGSVIVVIKGSDNDDKPVTDEVLIVIKDGVGEGKTHIQLKVEEVKVYNAICKPVQY